MDKLNWPLSIKEIELIISDLPKQKAPSLGRFTDEFYQTLKREIIPILYNLFQKIEAEDNLSSF